MYLLILNTGVKGLHVPYFPVPGYNSSLVIPFSMTYLYTSSIYPPLQPYPVQSEIYYKDNGTKLLYLI